MWYEAADGSLVQLDWYRDVESRVRYREGKVGHGICSASYCEEAAVFLTMRSERHWALCWDHARVLTTGYWRPGLGVEGIEVMETRTPRTQRRRRRSA